MRSAFECSSASRLRAACAAGPAVCASSRRGPSASPPACWATLRRRIFAHAGISAVFRIRRDYPVSLRTHWRFFTPPTHRHRADLGPTWPVASRLLTPDVFVSYRKVRSFSISIRPGRNGWLWSSAGSSNQLVNEALAAPAAMHDQIFEFLQPVQMPLDLRVSPARVLAHVAAREAELVALDLLLFALRAAPFDRPAAASCRVCGGNSSRDRPSTSCDSSLASSTSSQVASMYSSCFWPSHPSRFCVGAGTGRAARSARISVRNFM